MKTWTEFLENQQANNVKISTIKDQTSKLRLASEWKSLTTWKEEDLIRYITYLQGRGLKPSYIEMVKALLKKYFIWGGKEKIVANIKIKLPKKSIKATDILTPDDINKMIETASLNRDKALIASLYESGARINELLRLRVKDLQETEHGIKTLIPGTKTGEEYRTVLFVYSSQYLRNHILYPPLKQDDLIFNIKKDNCLKIVKKIAKEAGIEKGVYLHAFRHAQATYMVRKGYQESIIRAKLGWTGDSKMIARYQHIDGQDTINATIDKEGMAQPEIPRELIKPINIAKPIEIADNSLDLNRLSLENETLKQGYSELKSQMESLMKAFRDDAKYNNLKSINISEKGIEIDADDPKKHEPIENPHDVSGHIEKVLKHKVK